MALLYKTVCVLVSGKIGSGKTTFSNMLVSDLFGSGWNVEKFSFADPVKKIATYIGWDGVKDEKGRKLLQVLGTECGRAYNPDCWVHLLIDRTIPKQTKYPFDVIIIDDWRFPNEKEYIEKNILYDVLPLRITGRASTEQDNGHISETALPEEQEPEYYKSIIYNTGDLYSLQRTAYATSEYIINKYNKGEKQND